MNAPVCPVSRSQPIALQPEPVRPIVARATDLPSLIAAVNAAAKILMQTATPGPGANNLYPGYAGVPAPAKNGVPTVLVFDNWYEVGRNEEDLIVYHKDNNTKKTDKSQYVEVHRINSVSFASGGASDNARMTWNAPPPPR